MKLLHSIRKHMETRHAHLRFLPAIVIGMLCLFDINEAHSLLHQQNAQSLLTDVTPQTIMDDPVRLAAAMSLGKAIYAAKCAECHGDHMQGDPARYAPALNDDKWIFSGQDIETFAIGPADIEAIIRHGIRTDDPQTKDPARMPARGAGGNLTDEEIEDVTAYALELAGHTTGTGNIARGKAAYLGHGGCYDCHAEDGRGDTSIGATDLTAPASWLYGADYRSVKETITAGRQGFCPTFEHQLSTTEIVSTAIYVYKRGA